MAASLRHSDPQIVIPAQAGIQGGGDWGMYCEGLVPRWGRVGESQNPPRQLAVPNHNFGFSYLGVPAPAGMSYWYENDVTRPRECARAAASALFVLAPLRRWYENGVTGLQSRL